MYRTLGSFSRTMMDIHLIHRFEKRRPGTCFHGNETIDHPKDIFVKKGVVSCFIDRLESHVLQRPTKLSSKKLLSMRKACKITFSKVIGTVLNEKCGIPFALEYAEMIGIKQISVGYWNEE